MKNRFPMIAACLMVAVATTHAQTENWIKSYDLAVAKAKSANKLAMVFFHADWCTFCQRMKSTTFKSPRVWSVLKSVAPVMQNIDKEGAKTKEKLGVKVFPAFVFVAPDGSKFAEMNGYIGPTMFADEVEKYVAAFDAQPELFAQYKRDPNDGEVNARLAWLYAIKRQESQAMKHLADARRAKYRGPYMASAYNMVGDIFQLSERLDTATDYFKKGADVAKNPRDLSYSLVSLFSCYSIKGDKRNAKLYGEKLLALKGATPEYVAFVKEQMIVRGIKD